MPRERGQVGEGAVLSVSAAAAELGLREVDGIAWLRAQGLVSVIRLPPDAEHPQGRSVERVSWRRVLARLEQGEEPAAPSATPCPPVQGLRRARTL